MPELYDLAAARKRRKAKPKTETPVVEDVARPPQSQLYDLAAARKRRGSTTPFWTDSDKLAGEIKEAREKPVEPRPDQKPTTPAPSKEDQLLQWYDMAAEYGRIYEVPPEITLSLIAAESLGDPKAVGDDGHSVGLFQLHDEGVGYGYSVEDRYEPELQFKLMMPLISEYYKIGKQNGLEGRLLAEYTGGKAEKSDPALHSRYGDIYDIIAAPISSLRDIQPAEEQPPTPLALPATDKRLVLPDEDRAETVYLPDGNKIEVNRKRGNWYHAGERGFGSAGENWWERWWNPLEQVQSGVGYLNESAKLHQQYMGAFRNESQLGEEVSDVMGAFGGKWVNIVAGSIAGLAGVWKGIVNFPKFVGGVVRGLGKGRAAEQSALNMISTTWSESMVTATERFNRMEEMYSQAEKYGGEGWLLANEGIITTQGEELIEEISDLAKAGKLKEEVVRTFFKQGQTDTYKGFTAEEWDDAREFSYSWMFNPEAEKQFRASLEFAEEELGRRLTRNELDDLKMLYEDPNIQFFGEVFLDVVTYTPAVVWKALFKPISFAARFGVKAARRTVPVIDTLLTEIPRSAARTHTRDFIDILNRMARTSGKGVKAGTDEVADKAISPELWQRFRDTEPDVILNVSGRDIDRIKKLENHFKEAFKTGERSLDTLIDDAFKKASGDIDWDDLTIAQKNKSVTDELRKSMQQLYQQQYGTPIKGADGSWKILDKNGDLVNAPTKNVSSDAGFRKAWDYTRALWIEANLSARPGFTVRNMLDTRLRFMLAGGHIKGSLKTMVANKYNYFPPQIMEGFIRSLREKQHVGPLAQQVIEKGELSIIDFFKAFLGFNPVSIADPDAIGAIGSLPIKLPFISRDFPVLRNIPIIKNMNLTNIAEGLGDFNDAFEMAHRMRLYHDNYWKIFKNLDSKYGHELIRQAIKDPKSRKAAQRVWDSAFNNPEDFAKAFDDVIAGKKRWETFISPRVDNYLREKKIEESTIHSFHATFIDNLIEAGNAAKAKGATLTADDLRRVMKDALDELEANFQARVKAGETLVDPTEVIDVTKVENARTGQAIDELQKKFPYATPEQIEKTAKTQQILQQAYETLLDPVNAKIYSPIPEKLEVAELENFARVVSWTNALNEIHNIVANSLRALLYKGEKGAISQGFGPDSDWTKVFDELINNYERYADDLLKLAKKGELPRSNPTIKEYMQRLKTFSIEIVDGELRLTKALDNTVSADEQVTFYKRLTQYINQIDEDVAKQLEQIGVTPEALARYKLGGHYNPAIDEPFVSIYDEAFNTARKLLDANADAEEVAEALKLSRKSKLQGAADENVKTVAPDIPVDEARLTELMEEGYTREGAETQVKAEAKGVPRFDKIADMTDDEIRAEIGHLASRVQAVDPNNKEFAYIFNRISVLEDANKARDGTELSQVGRGGRSIIDWSDDSALRSIVVTRETLKKQLREAYPSRIRLDGATSDEEIEIMLKLIDNAAETAVRRGEVSNVDEYYKRMYLGVRTGRYGTVISDANHLAQAGMPDNWYYSRLEKALMGEQTSKVNPQAWLNRIRKHKGVTDEEMQWTGLVTFDEKKKLNGGFLKEMAEVRAPADVWVLTRQDGALYEGSQGGRIAELLIPSPDKPLTLKNIALYYSEDEVIEAAAKLYGTLEFDKLPYRMVKKGKLLYPEGKVPRPLISEYLSNNRLVIEEVTPTKALETPAWTIVNDGSLITGDATLSNETKTVLKSLAPDLYDDLRRGDDYLNTEGFLELHESADDYGFYKLTRYSGEQKIWQWVDDVIEEVRLYDDGDEIVRMTQADWLNDVPYSKEAIPSTTASDWKLAFDNAIEKDAIKYLDDLGIKGDSTLKYADLRVGNSYASDNYREFLLTLPVNKYAKEGEVFHSAHWSKAFDLTSEDNIIAHYRVTDRVIDGKRTLFVEEIQSDWFQGTIVKDKASLVAAEHELQGLLKQQQQARANDPVFQAFNELYVKANGLLPADKKVMETRQNLTLVSMFLKAEWVQDYINMTPQHAQLALTRLADEPAMQALSSDPLGKRWLKFFGQGDLASINIQKSWLSSEEQAKAIDLGEDSINAVFTREFPGLTSTQINSRIRAEYEDLLGYEYSRYTKGDQLLEVFDRDGELRGIPHKVIDGKATVQLDEALNFLSESVIEKLNRRSDELLTPNNRPYKLAIAQQEQVVYNLTNGVPKAPVSDFWHEIVVKRILRQAAEDNYDAIAFTSARQQAEQYPFPALKNMHEIKKIAWNPKNNRFDVFGTGYLNPQEATDSGAAVKWGRQQRFRWDKDHTNLADHLEIKEEDLYKWIGKKHAKQLLDSPKQTSGEKAGWHVWEQPTISVEDAIEKYRNEPEILRRAFGIETDLDNINPRTLLKDSLEERIAQLDNVHGHRKHKTFMGTNDLQALIPDPGEAVEVMSSGFTQFYDEQLPVFLNRFINDMGWKNTKLEQDIQLKHFTLGVVNDKQSHLYGPMHYMDLTDDVKASVMEGLPLRQAHKGALKFGFDERASIRLFEAADFSTLVHEFAGHPFLRQILRDNPADYKIAEDWMNSEARRLNQLKAAGELSEEQIASFFIDAMGNEIDEIKVVVGGDLTFSAEEIFARGFERYLLDGEAPVPALKYLFQRIKEYLLEIYKVITGSPLDLELSDDIRGVFNRILNDPRGLELEASRIIPGRPIIAYHGSTTAALQKTGLKQTGGTYLGFHVGTEAAASGRAALRTLSSDPGYLYKVEITPQKPYLPDGRILDERYDSHFFKTLDTLGRGNADSIYAPPGMKAGERGLLNWQELKEQGYDVIPYINSVEDAGTVSYLVIDPEAALKTGTVKWLDEPYAGSTSYSSLRGNVQLSIDANDRGIKAVNAYRDGLGQGPVLLPDTFTLNDFAAKTKEPFSYQDKAIEIKFIHGDNTFHKGQFVHATLMHAGDAYRGIAGNGKVGVVDRPYVNQKLTQIIKNLRGEDFGSEYQKALGSVSGTKERPVTEFFEMYIEAWNKAPIESPWMAMARDLNIALARNNQEEALRLAETLQSEMDAVVAGKYRRLLFTGDDYLDSKMAKAAGYESHEALQKAAADLLDDAPLTDSSEIVKVAYDHLIEQVNRQYESLDVQVQALFDDGRPYVKANNLRIDVVDSDRLLIQPTKQMLEADGVYLRKSHPLHAPSIYEVPAVIRDEAGEIVPMLDEAGEQVMYRMLENDVLQATHDYIAYFAFKNDFDMLGDVAAWQAHARTIDDPLARWALTNETFVKRASSELIPSDTPQPSTMARLIPSNTVQPSTKAPFEAQEEFIEMFLKDEQHKAQQIPGDQKGDVWFSLVHAGDVFREIVEVEAREFATYDELGMYADDKLKRAVRLLNETTKEGTWKTKHDDVVADNGDAIDRVVKAWRDIPVETDLQQLAKNMNIAMAEGRADDALAYADELQVFIDTAFDNQALIDQRVFEPKVFLPPLNMVLTGDSVVDESVRELMKQLEGFVDVPSHQGRVVVAARPTRKTVDLPWKMKARGEGDFYIKRVGNNAGKVSRTREGPSDIAFIVNPEELDSGYAYYMVQFLESQINAYKRGTAQQAITQEHVDRVLVDHLYKQVSGEDIVKQLSADISDRYAEGVEWTTAALSGVDYTPQMLEALRKANQFRLRDISVANLRATGWDEILPAEGPFNYHTALLDSINGDTGMNYTLDSFIPYDDIKNALSKRGYRTDSGVELAQKPSSNWGDLPPNSMRSQHTKGLEFDRHILGEAYRMWVDELIEHLKGSGYMELENSAELEQWARRAKMLKAYLNDLAMFGRDKGEGIPQTLIDEFGADSPIIKQLEKEHLRGAVGITNDAMIDYSRDTNLDQAMKQVVPFWKFPSRSIPWWIQTVATNPRILTIYNRIQDLSERIQVQAGATRNAGGPLPRLRGHFKLGDTDWYLDPFNALSFTDVMPQRGPSYDDENTIDPDAPIMNRVVNYLYANGPKAGLYLAPWVDIPIRKFTNYIDENQYPERSLFGQLDLIPPWTQRYIISRSEEALNWNENDYLTPQVPWRGYLIARELLSITATSIAATADGEEKVRLAREAETALGAQEGALYEQARANVEKSEYASRLFGYLTGAYAKKFGAGERELFKLRDEANRLARKIADDSKYEEVYKTWRYETGEGVLRGLYGTISWVRDEDDQPVYGKRWWEEVSSDITTSQQKTAYLAEKNRLQANLQAGLKELPVGDSQGAAELATAYYEANDVLLEKYPEARFKWSPYYRSDESIKEHIISLFMRYLGELRPRYDKTEETFDEYKVRLDNWYDVIIPASAAPALQHVIKVGAEEDVDIATAIGDGSVLLAMANRESYDTWDLTTDGVYDALNRVWRDNFYNKYWELVGARSGYMRDVAEEIFYEDHGKSPDVEEIIDWAIHLYGNQFDTPTATSAEVLRAAIEGRDIYSIEQKMTRNDTPEETMAREIWEVIGWFGPNKQSLRDALGGNDDWLDFWYKTDGDPTAFGDNEEFHAFYDMIIDAKMMVGVDEPSMDKTRDFMTAEGLNQQFRGYARSILGDDIFDLQSYYYSLSPDERRAFREL